ncbi:hypothetical protein DRN93_04410 [archaeon]|nr:MAG: hypothetical protein DRN93_04410 [archaeon]
MAYDPVDDVISILNNNWDSSISKPNIIKAYNIRAVDLRRGDYIIVGQVSEADDYVGIPLEFRRTAVISIMVKTKTSRERVREIAEEVRSILRDKDVWRDNGYLMMRLTRAVDMTDRERKIYTIVFDAVLQRLEKV